MLLAGLGPGMGFRDAAGVPPLDDLERFQRRIRENQGPSLQMPHDPHWNPLGHRLYGEALAEALVEAQVLPAPVARGG